MPDVGDHEPWSWAKSWAAVIIITWPNHKVGREQDGPKR
jgi:hypothetical protein